MRFLIRLRARPALCDEDLHRLADAEIIEKARSEGRVVLTMDLDFGYLMSVGGRTLPSVVVFRLDDERPSMVNERLREVLRFCSTELQDGAIIAVTETRLRVRRLPVTRPG